MRKIDYRERSNFYDLEVKKNKKIVNFIRRVSRDYNINSIINCPSASGIYLKEFFECFDNSIFIDIEKKMIDTVKQKIEENKYTSIDTKILDIKDLYKLNKKADCIIMLNQGLQYVSLKDFKELLNKIDVRYIIIDLFDFNKKGKLSYFNSNKENKSFFTSKFKYNGKLIKRYNKFKKMNNKVIFEYEYFNNNTQIYSTKFILYNYEFFEVNKIIKSSNYNLLKVFGDYNFKKFSKKSGHFILVLRRW